MHAGNGEVSISAIEPMLIDASSTTANANASALGVADDTHEEADPSQRWRSLEKLVSRPSPFGAETGELALGEFEPFENVSNGRPRARQKYG